MPPRLRLNRLLACALLVALAACARPPAERLPLRDLVLLPQDVRFFVPEARLHEPLIPPDRRDALAQAFLREHFAPWHRQRAAASADLAFWALASFKGKVLFGENTLPLDAGFLGRMREACRVEAYPDQARPAVAVQSVSLRALPTGRPVFFDFARAGQGFPFDQAQDALIPAGTPLLVTHESADGAWLLVESRFNVGFLPASAVAFAGEEFRREFEGQKLAAFLRDDVPVRDQNGVFRFLGRVGLVLPLAAEDDFGLEALVPVRGLDGTAGIVRARLSRQDAAPLPLAATPANLARVADGLLGRAYGWGGLFEDRDCSSTLQDLFATLGVFLPRNSRQQAALGRVTPLANLAAEDKRRLILASPPLLTLIAKPGHIMLYLGPVPEGVAGLSGEPAVLHTVWGLRSRDARGAEGRLVIGKTAITTLAPGREQPDIDWPRASLLEDASAVTVIGQ
jgi:cell wall-associated NlpC family hydrolase